MRKHLFNEYGLISYKQKNGDIGLVQKKRQKPEFDKVRINVKQQISNAIKDIEKVIPTLSEHLNRYINTGKDCAYQPDPDKFTDWLIRW